MCRVQFHLRGDVGFGGCMWILSDELENSNRVIYDSLEHLDGRVKKLEQQQQ